MALMVLGGCADPAGKTEETFTEINGNMFYRSQCPYGTLSEEAPLYLELWDCPMGVDSVNLVSASRNLVFKADCKEKLVTIRSDDGALNLVWQTMPNGVFNATFDGGLIGLSGDTANANSSCSTNAMVEVRGRVNCDDPNLDRDKVNIEAEILWWLGDSDPSTAPNLAFETTDRQCQLPAGHQCYLYTQQIIRQCQYQ